MDERSLIRRRLFFPLYLPRSDPSVWQLALGKLRALYTLLQSTSPTEHGPALAASVRALLGANYARLTAAWASTPHTGAIATEALLNLAVLVRYTNLTTGLYDRYADYALLGVETLYTVTPVAFIGPSLRALAQTANATTYAWLVAQYRTASSREYRQLVLRALASVTSYVQIRTFARTHARAGVGLTL